jgi:hypothetical protein
MPRARPWARLMRQARFEECGDARFYERTSDDPRAGVLVRSVVRDGVVDDDGVLR